MNYLRKMEYKIIPDKSFTIVHNCPNCKCKTEYGNTKRFRINANGNKLDIWLIYQCKKCKHTLNLSIYERQKINKISYKDYKLFLENNEKLAEKYGKSTPFFIKNKVEVNYKNIKYSFVDIMRKTINFSEINYKKGDFIIIENPYSIKISPEKQAAEILRSSRSQIKKMVKDQQIIINRKEKCVEIEIYT